MWSHERYSDMGNIMWCQEFRGDLTVFEKSTILLDCMSCIEEFITIEKLKENWIKEISDDKLRNNYCSENDSIPIQLVIQYPVRQMVLYRLVYRSSSMKSSQNTDCVCQMISFIITNSIPRKVYLHVMCN